VPVSAISLAYILAVLDVAGFAVKSKKTLKTINFPLFFGKVMRIWRKKLELKSE
jgi:hypothetical protein